jgi:hypothetical protein
MATYRPTPTSYYYSGQGRLGIGTRQSNGTLDHVQFVGNVTSLTLDIEVTKFEHKESMTGDRAVDFTVIQEKNATFSFTSESLILPLLAAGLYGSSGTAAGSSVTNELHEAKRGYAIPLAHPDVSSLTIETTAMTPVPLVEGDDAGDDYQVDYEFGTVYINSDSTVVTSATVATNVSIDYTYAGYDYVEAFTTGTPPEKYLRFEGLNTLDGDLRLIEIYRAAFDPLTGMEFINEEVGSGEFGGNALPDLTITDTAKSKYFRERRITV